MESMIRQGTKSKTSMVNPLLLLLLLPAVRIMVVEVAASDGLDPNSERPCSLRDPAMDPTHEVRYGHDMVWQIPSDPKAVLIVAHGTGMESLQFFDPGPKCEQCSGMPEGRTAMLEFLQRQYAVISVTAFQENWRVVSTIVKEWMAQYSLDSLPLTGWGHSAGTQLITTLTQALPIRAMVLMCGAGKVDVEALATPLTFPPTLFVYMPRGISEPHKDFTRQILNSIAMLKARGVEVAERQCWPKRVSTLFFAERILCMTEDMSQMIYAALAAAGWLDNRGYLKKNPSAEDFQSVLAKAKALPFCAASGKLCLIAHVEQELKMAFAVHSFTNDANDAIFPWMDSHVRVSSDAEASDLQSPSLTATI